MNLNYEISQVLQPLDDELMILQNLRFNYKHLFFKLINESFMWAWKQQVEYQ